MMRLGDAKTLAVERHHIPLADRPLDQILRIPHTTTVLARLATLTVGPDGTGVVERQALMDAKEDAEERDALLGARPAGCWCYGRGGIGERAVLVPGSEVPMVLSVYCKCPDGEARRAIDEQARRDGKAFADQRRIAGIWEAARIPERFTGCTLETFPATSHSMRTLVRRIRDWLGTGEWALVLHGGYGVGKTGLGIGALRAAADRRQVGLFVKAPDLLSKVRATYGKTANVTELDVLESLRTVSLLMLDDVGADRATDWATELLFQIIDARHDASLKTIVTTNLEPPEMAVHLGARTMHRFDEGAVFLHVDGPNLRKSPKGA